MTDGPNPVEPIAPSSSRSVRRRATFVILAGVLAIVGALVAGYYFAMRPVTLRIAVGPANSDDLRVVQALAQALNNQQHGQLRLRPVPTERSPRSASASRSVATDRYASRPIRPTPSTRLSISIASC